MWHIADQPLTSRLILGTALYPSLEVMRAAIAAAHAEIITVSLRRQAPDQKAGASFWDAVKDLGCQILPNTAGCRSVAEAHTTALMAREIFDTHWVKLEVIGDDYNLQPDSIALLHAAEKLVADGFEVFPYCTEDLVVAKRLVECGCRILMPWGSPIGSGQGLLNPYALRTLRQRLPAITLVVDAGIGTPSHAVQAMEMGVDAVLLNSAVALAEDPVAMAQAFKWAVQSGRLAYEAGRMPKRELASPSTPVVDKPFWHQQEPV